MGVCVELTGVDPFLSPPEEVLAATVEDDWPLSWEAEPDPPLAGGWPLAPPLAREIYSFNNFSWNKKVYEIKTTMRLWVYEKI